VKVSVVGLLGRPGQRRDLTTSVPAEQFGEEPWGPAVDTLDGPIGLDLTLEAVPGGVLVRGTVRASATSTCARCLTPTSDTWDVEVAELYRAVRPDDDDLIDSEEDGLEYLLVDADTQLELDQLVRDAIVVGQPVRVLCRPDCAGLCPSCGADRNVEPCQHGDEAPVDPRWEALRTLRLPGSGGAPDGT
jgi:uncharacterized protein